MLYTLIRSNRKTISIQVTEDLDVVVRAPRWVSRREIEYFLDEKMGWIAKQKARITKSKAQLADMNLAPLTDADIEWLKARAREVIPQRVEHFSRILGVSYGRISIRAQRTRWGSCSAKGNLNFNCLLMLAPPEALDYVVVHELCHRKVMNHSAAFWGEVAVVMPDYRAAERWLKAEGSLMLRRVR